MQFVGNPSTDETVWIIIPPAWYMDFADIWYMALSDSVRVPLEGSWRKKPPARMRKVILHSFIGSFIFRALELHMEIGLLSCEIASSKPLSWLNPGIDKMSLCMCRVSPLNKHIFSMRSSRMSGPQQGLCLKGTFKLLAVTKLKKSLLLCMENKNRGHIRNMSHC